MKITALITSILLSAGAASAQSTFDASKEFSTKCAMCHGPDGRAKTPMGQRIGAKDLGSAEVQKMSDAEIAKTIAKGNGRMPGYESIFSEKQVAAMVKYVRALKK